MKRLFYLVLTVCLLVPSACSRNAGKCIINGHVSEWLDVPDNTFAVITDRNLQEVCRTEIKDGKFRFEVDPDDGQPHVISLDGEGLDSEKYGLCQTVVIFEADTLEACLGDNYVIGGKVNTAMFDLQNGLETLYAANSQEMEMAFVSGDMEKVDSISADCDMKVRKFVEDAYNDNLDNFAGLQALMLMLTSTDEYSIEELEAFAARGGEMISANPDVRKMIDRLKTASSVGRGSRFVNVFGTDDEGDAVSLADFIGGEEKYTVVDFWASWCGPCRAAVSDIRALLEKYGDRGLAVVGINCSEENTEDGINAAHELGMTWPVIYASDGEVEKCGISALPTLLLISNDGTIVERHEGSQGIAELVSAYFE